MTNSKYKSLWWKIKYLSWFSLVLDKSRGHYTWKSKEIKEETKTILQVVMNIALLSGKPIPAEKVKREYKDLSAKIPEEIKKELRDRLRAGDLSVWNDKRVMKYYG